MPYIAQESRAPMLSGEIQPKDWTPGDLNFLITVTLNAYVEGHGLSYSIINDVIGALECAKAEFYRRVAVPYEDQKIIENGDVE
ncbi:MAG: hypothetical protein L0Y56_01275 [Nitrospira sp.]|nr:hypothetical protein [Nitrospira sp.]